MAYALITGASGGIGMHMAIELAKRKTDLLLVARSKNKLIDLSAELQSNYGVSVSYLNLDLSQATAPDIIQNWILEHKYSVNILINNAGYGLWGEVDTTSREALTNMMQLNMVSVTNLCHVLIPELKKHNRSYILNVASTAAYQAVPTLAVYAASKSFIVLFSRALRIELKNTPISVSCLSPGATDTNFVNRAGMDSSLQEKAKKFSMNPEVVAKIGIDGMFKGKAEILPGFINWISVQLTYWMPKFIPEKIAEALYKPNSSN